MIFSKIISFLSFKGKKTRDLSLKGELFDSALLQLRAHRKQCASAKASLTPSGLLGQKPRAKGDGLLGIWLFAFFFEVGEFWAYLWPSIL